MPHLQGDRPQNIVNSLRFDRAPIICLLLVAVCYQDGAAATLMMTARDVAAAHRAGSNPSRLARDQPSAPERPANERRTATEPTGSVSLSFNSECDVLVTNPAGQRMGRDRQNPKFVNEIPGAESKLGPPLSNYLLPLDRPDRPYTIKLSARSPATGMKTDIVMTGPGFLAGFKEVTLSGSESLTMSITPDGRRLSFTAGAAKTPWILMTTSEGRGKPSYRFEVGGIHLSEGKTVVVSLDTGNGRLYFGDDDDKRNQYDLRLRRTNPDGIRSQYARQGIVFGASDHYMLDFGRWDGKEAMCFYVDDRGDGFENKPCERLSNQNQGPSRGEQRVPGP